MINSHQVHDCSLKIVNVYRIFHDIIAEVISFPNGHTFIYSCSGHPDREPVHIVVATLADGICSGLSKRSTSKFCGTQDQSILQHAALPVLLLRTLGRYRADALRKKELEREIDGIARAAKLPVPVVKRSSTSLLVALGFAGLCIVLPVLASLFELYV